MFSFLLTSVYSDENLHTYTPECSQYFVKKINSLLVDTFQKAQQPKSCYRGSLLQILDKTGALKIFAKLIEKHMFLSLIFIKVAVLGAVLSKKRCWEIVDIFKNASFKEHFWVTASILIAWNTKSLSFSLFLLTFLVLIYLFFSLLGLYFSPSFWVITMTQIHFGSYTVCTCLLLNQLPPVFLFWIN